MMAHLRTSVFVFVYIDNPVIRMDFMFVLRAGKETCLSYFSFGSFSIRLNKGEYLKYTSQTVVFTTYSPLSTQVCRTNIQEMTYRYSPICEDLWNICYYQKNVKNHVMT